MARDEPDAALGDQLYPLTQSGAGGQCVAEQLLDGVVAVNVGVIEAGDAQVEALFDPAKASSHVEVPARHAPGAGHDG